MVYTQLLTTGASENTKKMNIYDFAGNEWEWTVEKIDNTNNPCINRGGYYGYYGSNFTSSYRNNNGITISDFTIGLRSVLY